MRWIRWVLPLAGCFHQIVSAETVSSPAPITRLAEIRLMPTAVAAKALPVAVTGVVTWCSPGRLSGGFMIDQDGAGIFVVGDSDLPDGRKGPGVEKIRLLSVGDKAPGC